MFRPTRSTRRFLGLLVAFLLVPSAAFAALPIEGYATYAPQNTCSPNAKPGTVKLAAWLQKTYPGTGSYGISRSCKDGGVSEHKEGRAFDWSADVNSARDRASVADFFAKAFATDADGNTHALARRMGIMYLIWNDQIYSSYYGFKARPYRPCAVVTNCSKTARHRDHVHISLSRAGGNGTTSWYTGGSVVPPAVVTSGTPTTAAAPKVVKRASGVINLKRTPYAAIDVPATGATKVTSFKLKRGFTYKITAAGLYGFGDPGDVADASCSWTGDAWSATPADDVAQVRGSLDLLVNGARTATSCRADHVYTKVLKPTRTATLRLRVANAPAGTNGTLRVLVSRRYTNVAKGLPKYPTAAAAPALAAAQPGTALSAETVEVPAGSTGVLSTGSLVEGTRYRITVSGTAVLGGGVQSDGRCLTLAGAGSTWHPQAALDRRTPGAAHGRLFLDGAPFEGGPTTGSDVCAVREHTVDLVASRTGRLQLALWDPWSRSDDTGTLSVRVEKLLRPVARKVETAPDEPVEPTETVAPAPVEPSEVPLPTLAPTATPSPTEPSTEQSADSADVPHEH